MLLRDQWAKIGAKARLKELEPAEREAREIRTFLGRGRNHAKKNKAQAAAQSRRMKAWWAERRKKTAATAKRKTASK